MKSIWDKLFADDAAAGDLSEEELEEAVRELANAAGEVEKMQLSPEHERILRRIQEKLGSQQEE